MTEYKQTDSRQDFKSALATAKTALELIGRYRTRPTPHVFEVWFRYVEGSHEQIRNQIDHAIQVAGEVTAEFLEGLQAQFLQNEVLVSSSFQTRDALATEIAVMQSSIEQQREVGNQFDDQVRATSSELETEHLTAEHFARCVHDLLQTNSAMQLQLSQLNAQLTRTESKLDSLEKELIESQRTLITDPLTGVGNRRFLDLMLEKTLNQSASTTGLVYLLLCDIDRFKSINDDFGHATGDAYVKFVADGLSKVIGDASLARFGGDEFAVLVYQESYEELRELVGELCDYFKTAKPSVQVNSDGASVPPRRISLSIGAAARRPDDSAHTWFERADKLMYAAKESGGNSGRVERDFSD